MSQPPTQDLLNNIDFTTFPSLSAAELNLGFSQLVPNTSGTINDGSVGVGGMVFTADTALNTPQVPNASITTKWQGYLWIRIPFSSTAGTVAPIGYFWNNSKGNDATFLKWQSTQVDLTAVNAAITALQAAVTTAQTTATAANNTANTALTNSAAANATANSANTAASAAQAAAATALTTANTALATANTAQATANAASAGIAAATATANAANATSAAAAAEVAAIVSSKFATGQFAIFNTISGGPIINAIPHNLGATPKVRGVLVCIAIAGEAGYSQNDEVGIAAFGGLTGGAYTAPAFITTENATTVSMIQCLTGSTSYGVGNKVTGTFTAITQPNWQAKIYAEL